MIDIKKALAVGAITITSFPSIVFSQNINYSRPAQSENTPIVRNTTLKDIDMFSGTFTSDADDIELLAQAIQGISHKYLDTGDSAEKALERVYAKVNKLLSDMVDDITLAKNTPPWMLRR
jgi:hypothetical protein